MAAFPWYKLAGGGGAGDQRVWKRSRGDSESHRGDETKTGFLFGEGNIFWLGDEMQIIDLSIWE